MSEKATLETVRFILDDNASESDKLSRLRMALKEPDVFEELAEAFPNEFPEIQTQWKTLTLKTWNMILSRPKAWKIAMRYLNRAGISL